MHAYLEDAAEAVSIGHVDLEAAGGGAKDLGRYLPHGSYGVGVPLYTFGHASSALRSAVAARMAWNHRRARCCRACMRAHGLD